MVSEHCRAVAMVPCAVGPRCEHRDWAPGVHTIPPDQRFHSDPVVSFYPAGARFRDSDRVSVATLPGSHLESESAPARIADVRKTTIVGVPTPPEPNDLDRRRLLARLGISRVPLAPQ